MKFKNFIIVFSILIVTILGMYNVSAANVCTGASGNLLETKQFTVTVGNNLLSSEKIVLKQSKGNTKQQWYGKEKKVGMYGRFYVSVYDNTSRKYVYNNVKWKNSTFTISSSKLKRKHSYTITVKGDTNQYVGDSYTPYVFRSWLSYPTWSVSKTGSNINSCGW